MAKEDSYSHDELQWRTIGFIILSIRFVQGWIFWGGGSRRFIYDPSKLDPYAPQWMANKLQSTMPGALFDTGDIIRYLLHHFDLLFIAIILFSLVELVCGLMLILGLFTRIAAALTAFISVVLMVFFGWQGSTCLDEWTMAVSNFSMAMTLILSGAASYSLDAMLIRRYPHWKQSRWFLVCGSAAWTAKRTAQWGLIFCLLSIGFTVGTYSYLRGAVFGWYHAGPVNPDKFHLSLSKGQLTADALQFVAYVDAGPTEVPMYIIRVELLDKLQKVSIVWDAESLSKLPADAIQNHYDYNKITSGLQGLVAPESAKATISLPLNNKKLQDSSAPYDLRIYSIDGQRFDLGFSDKPIPKTVP